MAWNPTVAGEFRPIPEFPAYSVSPEGCVRGPSGKVLKPSVSETGHLFIGLSRARGYSLQTLFVHKAVLLTFVGPCPEGMECRHLDGDPANNRLDNLKWGTPKENGEDRVRHGTQRRGETSPSAKLTAQQVKEIRERIGTASLRELAREYGVSHTCIRRAANGMKWKHLPA